LGLWKLVGCSICAPAGVIIVYCGGGISATVDLFLLHQLGFDDLTL
jgi:3-mercaptopyruvate sulfurtransferase SseA